MRLLEALGPQRALGAARAEVERSWRAYRDSEIVHKRGPLRIPVRQMKQARASLECTLHTGCSPVEHSVGNMIDQMDLELKVDYELDPVEFFAAHRLYGVHGPVAGFQRGTAGAQCRRRLDRGAFTLPNETSCLFQIGVPPRPCESVARARANSSGRVYTALIA